MARKTHHLRVPNEVADLIRGLHPDLKRKIRAALENILENPHAGKALRDELDGLRSFRVGRFRIVYGLATRNRVDLVAVGPRESIYEETYRRIRKGGVRRKD
jgi:mRNA interferase RelE/StbE